MSLACTEIYRQLPMTNCGECGEPACLAFIVKLASKKTSLESCPYVPGEIKESYNRSFSLPNRPISIGVGVNSLELANQNILFRHEEAFHHPVGIAVEMDASLSADEIVAYVEEIRKLRFQRGMLRVGVDLIAIRDAGSCSIKHFVKTVTEVSSMSRIPLILMSDDSAVLEAGLEVCANRRPLIHAATKDNYGEMVVLAKRYNCPLAVAGAGLEELAPIAREIRAMGVEDLVLDPMVQDTMNMFGCIPAARLN